MCNEPRCVTCTNLRKALAANGFTDKEIEEIAKFSREFTEEVLRNLGLPIDQLLEKIYRSGHNVVDKSFGSSPFIVTSAGRLELTGKHLAVLRGVQLGQISVMSKREDLDAALVLQDFSDHNIIGGIKIRAQAGVSFYTADLTPWGRECRKHLAEKYGWDGVDARG